MSKEWKGNKKSVSTMLGISTTWHPEERAAGDYYTTDPTAVEQFVNHYHNHIGDFTGIIDKIWEPACGCGNISTILKSASYDVISTDLHDRGYGKSGIDFLTAELPTDVTTIITNPPYALADDFVKHAMDILPNYGRYFALMNLSYLAGQKRFKEIYNNGYLHAIHVYTHRINCYKNNEKTGHSSPINYAWFEYLKISHQINTHFQPLIYWI